MSYQASDWGFKEKINKKEQILWFLWRAWLRCRVWPVSSVPSSVGVVGLGTESERHHFWCSTIYICKKNAKTTSEHLSVLSLYLSLSLRDSLHLFCPCLSYLPSSSLCFCFLHVLGFMNLYCWQEKLPCLTINNVHCLCRPGSDICVLTCWDCNIFLPHWADSDGVGSVIYHKTSVKTLWHSLYCLLWQTALILYSKTG